MLLMRYRKRAFSTLSTVIVFTELLLAVLFFLPCSTFSQTPGVFHITGEIKPMPHVEDLYIEITENDKPGRLFVILKENSVETIADILEGRFKLSLDWKHVRDEITLRAIYPEGLVALEDRSFNPEKIFEDKDGGKHVINQIIILTRIEDRFLTEKNKVLEFLSEGDCLGAMARLDQIEKNFLPKGPNYFYIISKIKADILYHGPDKKCPYPENDFESIFRIEENKDFQDLSSLQKFNLYLQFGRALQNWKIPGRYTASGHSVLDIIIHCFEKAISLQTPEELRNDDGWRYTSELVEELYRSEQYEKNMNLVCEFFERSKFPRSQLRVSQKECVINLLAAYSDSLTEFSERLAYSEAEYVKEMAVHPICLQYWMNFGNLLENWKYLYPKQSRTRTGRKLRVCLELFHRISDLEKGGGI